jgi:hypothetical protein
MGGGEGESSRSCRLAHLFYCRVRQFFFFSLPRVQEPKNQDIFELELELIQTQMTQKPMLRAEVYARALRASQNR